MQDLIKKLESQENYVRKNFRKFMNEWYALTEDFSSEFYFKLATGTDSKGYQYDLFLVTGKNDLQVDMSEYGSRELKFADYRTNSCSEDWIDMSILKECCKNLRIATKAIENKINSEIVDLSTLFNGEK